MLFNAKEKNKRPDCDKCKKECSQERAPVGSYMINDFLPDTLIHTCPIYYFTYMVSDQVKLIYEMYLEYIRYNSFHFNGGINEQPWWLIEGYDIIVSTIDLAKRLEKGLMK